ncbi:MAG: protein kinase, partial [Planctomycetota bacterium]|nr:protein kinase [Planctomycetota bacterium]
RFIREARITASLSHPNIPPIYELGMNSSGEHYMLMKVIEGQSLKEAISEVHSLGQSNPKEVRRLLEALVKVCEAVAYAHSREVIHRDLKPENIMIGEFGEVMVLDWGLARDFSDKTVVERVGGHPEKFLELKEAAQKEGLTGKGDLLGTVGYMAPEQVDGEANKQSDVFALGAILTEILTGKKAIAGDSVISKLSSTIHGRISGPRQLDGRSPRELNALALKSMAMEFEQRLSAVQLFVQDLKAFLLGEDLDNYHYSWFERSQRWLSRRPTLLISSLLIGILLLSSLYFWSVLEDAELRRIESRQASDTAVAKKERIERVLRLFEEAADAAARNSIPQDKIATVEEALTLGGRTKANLLRAASIYKLGQRKDLSEDVLKEVTGRFAPAYDALYQLHLLDPKSIDPKESSEHLERILELSRARGDENRYVYIARLSEAFRGAKWSEAVLLSERCKDEFAANPYFFYRRGLMNSSLKEYRKAWKDFRYALKLDGKSALFALHFGYACERVNRRFDAKINYDLAISLDANCIEAWVARAKIRRQNNNLIQSTRDWREVLVLDPKNELANELLVVDLLALRKSKEAMLVANKALDLLPNSATMYRARGRLYVAKGELEEAIRDYKVAVRLSPEDPSFRFELACVYFAQKDLSKAKEMFEEILGKNPKDGAAFFMIGRVSFAKRNWSRADALFTRAISVDPKVARYYFYRSMSRSRQKKLKAAIVDVSKTISIDPNFAEAYRNRGHLFKALGQNKEAALDFESFLRLAPKDPSMSEKRSFIQKHLGRASKH